MKLVIREFWSKLEPVAEHGKSLYGSFVNKPIRCEYEQKGQTFYPNGGGWKDKKEWRDSVKHRNRFLGFDEQGRAKFDLGTHYGIHSYQLVSLED